MYINQIFTVNNKIQKQLGTCMILLLIKCESKLAY